MSRKAGVTVDYREREAQGSGRAVAVEEESKDTDRQPQRDLGVFGGQRTGKNLDRRWWRQGWSPEEEKGRSGQDQKAQREGGTYPDDDHDGNKPAHA